MCPTTVDQRVDMKIRAGIVTAGALAAVLISPVAGNTG